ncbi:MAG: MgtC/SapB family protein, partial [Gemmatimonadaceae bacterium]
PAALATGGAALAVAAFVMATRRPGARMDATTEASALVVLALGALAGQGQLALAGGTAAIIVLALVEKARLHGWVRRLGEQELLAALHFAVLALVILPVLPTEPLPVAGGAAPRTLWIVVLLFSGLNFAGFVARRVVGASRGYGVTGLLGGLISSTAVTLQFSRESRRQPELAGPLGLGVVAACTALLPRVLVVTTILNAGMAARLVPFLLPPLMVGIALIGLGLVSRRAEAHGSTATEREEVRSPLGLWSAIQMTVAFQAVLVALEYVQRLWGAEGLITSAAVLGLTNMDALTLAMSRLGTDSGEVALGAMAIAVGVLANTVLKLGLTLSLGTSPFRRVAATGLVLLLVASAVGLWLGQSWGGWWRGASG